MEDTTIVTMGKILYVRGFDDSLHDDLNEISKKEGVEIIYTFEQI